MQLIKQRLICQLILPQQPDVRSWLSSEMPIMFVNVSGDYDRNEAERIMPKKLQDRFEELPEVNNTGGYCRCTRKRDTGECRSR